MTAAPRPLTDATWDTEIERCAREGYYAVKTTHGSCMCDECFDWEGLTLREIRGLCSEARKVLGCEVADSAYVPDFDRKDMKVFTEAVLKEANLIRAEAT